MAGIGLPLCRTGAVVIALSSCPRVACVYVTCLLHSAITGNVEFKQRARVSSISFKLGKLSLRLLTCCGKCPVVKLHLGPPASGTTEDCQTSVDDDPRSGRHTAATEDVSTERVPGFHSFKSTVSRAGAGKRMSSVSRRVLYLLKGTVKRAPCCSKICSASAGRRPEGAEQCRQSRTASSSKQRRKLCK